MSAEKTEQEQLNRLREKIDKIDTDIQKLISERAGCAQQVAAVKMEYNPQAEPVFYRPEREAQVLREVMLRNQGPLADEAIARIFREIMSTCLALEQPMQVAFLGPEGTFTQAAALKHFGRSVICKPMASIDEIFREVESGSANYGVVPVENSTEGMVNPTLDCFINSELRICGEVELRIHHHLLTKDSVPLENICRVYSHEQSLAQCRQWLNANLPHAERVSVSSNAEAASRAAKTPCSEEGGLVAAIAGDMAAQTYQLGKQFEQIEDQPDNTTRFLVIGKQVVAPSGKDKTSIIVATRNRPGALYHLLEPFQRKGISLTRIETRPARHSTWAYAFFIDFEGHCQEENIREILDFLEEDVIDLHMLGSYPMAVL